MKNVSFQDMVKQSIDLERRNMNNATGDEALYNLFAGRVSGLQEALVLYKTFTLKAMDSVPIRKEALLHELQLLIKIVKEKSVIGNVERFYPYTLELIESLQENETA